MAKDHLIKVNEFYLYYMGKDIEMLERSLLLKPKQRKTRAMLNDLYERRAKYKARIAELEMLE